MPKIPPAVPPVGKVCSRCKEYKPISEFTRRTNRPGFQYTPQCRACDVARVTANYRKKHPVPPPQPPATEKRCTQCGVVKPLDAFAPRGDRPHVLRSECIGCKNAAKRSYRERNRDRINEREARYRDEHRADVRTRCRQWHRDHPERSAEIRRESRARHPERIRSYNHAYQQQHADRYRAYWNARRARMLGNGGSYTPEEWEALKDRYSYRCLCCGATDRPLTADHIVPVTRGGHGYITNIQPLCQPCNSSKGNRIIDYRPARDRRV